MELQSGDPAKRARAIVQAVTHFNNPKIIADVRRIVLPFFISADPWI